MKPVTLSISLAAVFLLAGAASATLVTDYMEYGDTSALLETLTTADTTGWAGDGWTGSSSSVRYNISETTSGGLLLATNIPYVATGYVSNFAGGVAVGMDTPPSLVRRELSTPSSGTVWASFVAKFTYWTGLNFIQRVQIGVNGFTATSFGLASGLPGAANTTLRPLVITNGVVATANAAQLPADSNWLVVAKLETDVSGTTDALTMWLFRRTANLSGQNYDAIVNQAYYTFTAAQDDYWGSAITNLALIMHSARSPVSASVDNDRLAYADSLRVSQGALTDDQHAYEVLTGISIPEPALLVLAPLALLALRRR
ncbi:hypothetical protein GX586_11235 [bacterium]|nr:hypothetical protein [bacterium]